VLAKPNYRGGWLEYHPVSAVDRHDGFEPRPGAGSVALQIAAVELRGIIRGEIVAMHLANGLEVTAVIKGCECAGELVR